MAAWNPHWIESLHSGAASDRARAAHEIFAFGRSRALEATRAWFEHTELSALLCPENDGQPHVTVGLAVHPETFAKIHRANGSPRLAEVPPDQDASEFELQFVPSSETSGSSVGAGPVPPVPTGASFALDILTARESHGSGAIARFLAKQGEGIQQVEFRCTDVDLAAALLRQHFSIDAVYPAKRPGANGSLINFLLVPCPDNKKILIELYQLPF